jgi:hypothetical protein
MRGTLFFVAFLGVCSGNWFTDKIANAGLYAMGFDVGDTCGFTRKDALQCIKRYVDYDHNGKITCEEFERAKALYMPPRMKDALWLAKKFGFDVHFDQVLYGNVYSLVITSCGGVLTKRFAGCDANKDCQFTEQDWIDSEKRCLPFPADLCKLKTACDVCPIYHVGVS